MTKAKSSQSHPYRIRESRRAKHVSIKVSHLGEVEVVVPRGFDRSQIPAILTKRQDWIVKTRQRLAAERRMLSPDITEPASGLLLPQTLSLRSIAEEWSIRYRRTAVAQITLGVTDPRQLMLWGEVNQPQACYQALRQWLIRKAECHLTPWLRQVSSDVALPFNQIAVRGQKTIWGSCSAKHNISLNYKLLFLPPRLVRYLFIHELCHTVHLNHSNNFWALVAEKEPNFKQLDSELSKAWIYIPAWVERSSSPN
jgi:hypothetical protein